MDNQNNKSSIAPKYTWLVSLLAAMLVQASPALSQDISQTRPADGLSQPNGTAGVTFTPGISCDHPVSVVADGSIDALVGHCPRTPVPPAYTIQFDYNNPNVDEFYQGVVVWANAGGLFSDGELRSFNITINYLDLLGNPQTISGPASIGNTTSFNDPKVVTPASLGGPTLISGVSSFSIDTLSADGTGEAVFREMTLLRAVPEISLQKTAVVNDGGDGFADAGDTITYTYVVTNTATPTVFNVNVTEPGGANFSGTNGAPTPAYLSGGANYDAGSDTTDLRDGESVTFQATYTLSAADIAAESVTNSATAEGTDFHGVSATDTSGTSNANDDPTVTPLTVRPPTATNNAATNNVIGTPTVIDVLSDDTAGGVPIDPASVVIIDPATGNPVTTLAVANQGTWSVNSTTGAITFTPEAGFTGDPTPVGYTVDDENGNTSNEATVSVDYVSAPVATDDTVANPNPGTPTVIDPFADNGNGVDSDADGTLDPTTVALIDPATGNPVTTLAVANQGTWSVNPTTGAITFTPDAGFTGDPTSVGYTVDDNDGSTSNEASVTVTYGDAPVATDDTVANPNVGTPTVIDPFADNGNGVDSDADGTLDPTTVALIDPATGNPVTTLAVANQGTWSVNPTTGAITFTPDAGFTGDPTPVGYTVDDSDGNTSNEASVAVTYGDAPVANDDFAERDTVAPVTLNPLANDSDADSGNTLDPTTVVLIDPDTGNPVTTLVVDGEGTWAVNLTTGDVTFTPEDGFQGTATPVAYTVDDADGNTSNQAAITVSFGDPPVASNDTVTADGPGPVVIDPLMNDDPSADPLDPTSVTLTGTNAPAGSVLSANGKSLTVPGEGMWTVAPDTGLVTFTPAPGFSGAPTPAAYTVADMNGRTSNEAVLSVFASAPFEITANDDGPVLVGSNGDTSATSVLRNDTLGGTPITDPSVVTLTPVSVPTPASGAITMNADGTVTVAPDTTPGTYTLTYEICETANPTNCATASVEVEVIDAGAGLVEEIEEDLISIIEEDLANTLQQQSVQIGGYSADALDRLRDRGQGQGGDQCLDAVNLHAKNILFNVDSAIILPDYFKPVRYETLDRIATILIGCPGTAFEIAGHTDSDASDAYNIDLSQRRVNAVLQALAARGVDTSGYIARGYGESQPIATNATAAGKAQNRRVEFRVLDGIDNTYQGPCDDSFSLVRNFNLNADENGVNADGQFVRDQHDCITDRREVFEGTLSYLDTQTGQTQSAINLSYRREQYRGGDSVFGYFAGLYGSKSEVTRLANGEINGFGVNAGIYGANRLQNTLFVDYYLGGALGRHSFDLAFDRDIGTIDASGDYQYFAGFTGAALSGEVALGDTTFTPRIGFDYVYTPGADVDVVAELSGLSQAGNLELDAISGGRVFAEVRFDHLVDDGSANIWFNPRVACYQSLGALDGACGVGGSIGIESVEQNNGFTYGAELDGEWGENYTQGALSLRASRDLNVGTLSGDAGVTRNGNATLGGTYEIEF